MQLAGQNSENNIQEFLVGSQYPKSENLVRNPEIFLTFLLVGLSPGYRTNKSELELLFFVCSCLKRSGLDFDNKGYNS